MDIKIIHSFSDSSTLVSQPNPQNKEKESMKKDIEFILFRFPKLNGKRKYNNNFLLIHKLLIYRLIGSQNPFFVHARLFVLL